MFNWLATPFCGLLPLLAALFTAATTSAAPGPAAKGGNLVTRTNDGRKQLELSADAVWQINVPGRFDASGLAFHRGRLLTVNDRGSDLFEVVPGTNGLAELKPTGFFAGKAMVNARLGGQRLDCEGIAVDESVHLYLCEESRRLVFKSSSDGKSVTTHQADWSTVRRYFSADVNASFEGIAVGDGTLYLANERSSPRIVAIDLATWKVIGSFLVDSTGFAFGGPHYSDLAYREGRLWVLDRNHRSIYEVDSKSKRVLAEYSFARMELNEEVAYRNQYPTGAMEGLAVDAEYFWLVTDNNGRPRFKYPKDTRPTLFRCRRPK